MFAVSLANNTRNDAFTLAETVASLNKDKVAVKANRDGVFLTFNREASVAQFRKFLSMLRN